MKQGLYVFLRHAEFGLAATAVYEEADADDDAASLFNDVDDFLYGAARRDDVFYDEDAFARFDAEAAAQRHDAFFPFRKDGPRA